MVLILVSILTPLCDGINRVMVVVSAVLIHSVRGCCVETGHDCKAVCMLIVVIYCISISVDLVLCICLFILFLFLFLC